MALDDTKVEIARTGHYFVADVGTEFPTSLPVDGSPWTPTTGWSEVGHTSADSPMTITRDGGDTTTNGTWQAPNLITSVADITYAIEMTLLQGDEESLKLYFGGGQADPTTGDFQAPKVPAGQERALMVQMIHTSGTRARWLKLPKVTFIGSDNVEAATDDFTGYPVTATINDPGADSDYLFLLTGAAAPSGS